MFPPIEGKVVPMKLENQVAIITGGGRGIGRSTALAFAQEGADLVLAARTLSEIETVAGEVCALGRQALAIPTDVTQKSQVDAMVKRTLDTFGRVDILVSNAGVAIHNPIPKIREEDWDLNIALTSKASSSAHRQCSVTCASGSPDISSTSRQSPAKMGTPTAGRTAPPNLALSVLPRPRITKDVRTVSKRVWCVRGPSTPRCAEIITQTMSSSI